MNISAPPRDMFFFTGFVWVAGYEYLGFPRIEFGDPPLPRYSTKLFYTELLLPAFNTGLLQPTFEEGTGCFVSGGPYGLG